MADKLNEQSATPLPRSVNSPEFRREALRDLKDMARKGHVNLADGNAISDDTEPPEGPEK
jgi:hypothetical protein